MDKTPKHFNLLTFIRWNERYQPLTIDTTKDKYNGRCRLGLNFLYFPSSRFLPSIFSRLLFSLEKYLSIYANKTEKGMNNLAKLAEHQKNQMADKI